MIVLGLAAGLLANMLIPGKRSQGLIITCVTGIAGALPGGWAATRLFPYPHPGALRWAGSLPGMFALGCG